MATMPVPKGFHVTSGYGPRWGTTHYGTDFGKGGGSGGHPVYAVKDGTVLYSGYATGFGRWVVLDHPASVGGGTSVNGHVIPEVKVGDKVKEGQRIARIDPNSSTNGGVAPHLHYEYHEFGYAQPGPARLDPMKSVLVDAKWVGEKSSSSGSKPESQQVKTIYGVDISNHQDGISCKRIAAEGFRFCIIKATEGTWRDPIFRSHLADACSTDMYVAAYVYVRHDATPQGHAQALHQQLGGDTSVPVALDIEHNSGSSVAHWKAIRDAIERLGYRVILTYLPEWYWTQVGRPSLVGLPPLWSSRYPSENSAYASVLFASAGTRGWQEYGGLPVKIWQFTDRAQVAGQRIDANAFRGTESQLKELFTGEGEEELTMSQLEDLKKHITAEANKTRKFIEVYLGPNIQDTKDIRQQITGGRDAIPGDIAASYPGWPTQQLTDAAQDKGFDNLTLMELVALAAKPVIDEAQDAEVPNEE